jgi:hypothetical protein
MHFAANARIVRADDHRAPGAQEAADAPGDPPRRHALFAERGFEATTIADIAAAADIAPRTFSSCFASNEEAVVRAWTPRWPTSTARCGSGRPA